MRFLSFLTTLLITVLLASCGGGGGSPGISTGSVQIFSVAAPTALTLQVGLTQQYVIQGGVKPYTVFSTNPAVAVGWLVGENVVAVGSTAAGTASITVQDSKGTAFVMAVTAGSSTAFFTTAPSALTLAPGALASQTYKLGGGTPPYKAVSSFPSAVSVVVNGNDMTITALQVSGSPTAFASANITMTDSSSPVASLSTAVTLGTIPLAVTPNAYTVYIGDIFRSIITGGTPPYRALVGIDESVLSARIVNGNQLEAVGGQVADGAVVQVVDANNVSVPVTIKIVAGQDVLRVQPNALAIPENANTPDITIMVYGASATGGIQVFTTDSTILKPLAPVKNADGSGYAVTLTGGNTCSITAPVAPAAAVPAGPGGVPPAVPAVVGVSGDRSVTITVMDAKGKLGTSAITIKDTNGAVGC